MACAEFTDTLLTHPRELAKWIEEEILSKGYRENGYPKEWDFALHRAEWAIILSALKAYK